MIAPVITSSQRDHLRHLIRTRAVRADHGTVILENVKAGISEPLYRHLCREIGTLPPRMGHDMWSRP